MKHLVADFYQYLTVLRKFQFQRKTKNSALISFLLEAFPNFFYFSKILSVIELREVVHSESVINPSKRFKIFWHQ